MGFGECLKKLRKQKDLSQRRLAELANISNTEISRIESGKRKNPAPSILKAIAPYLDVSYSYLMKEAGYLEDVIEHEGYTEYVFKDEEGKIIDIYQRAKKMYKEDSEWANLAYRVSTSELDDSDMEIIKAQTQALLKQFLKKKK